MEVVDKEEDKLAAKSNDISIQVDEGDNSWLAAQILAKASTKSSSLCSIYRVPPEISKGIEHRFKPVLVSIGPYNYKKQTFKFTEKHKKWYLQDLFSRSPPAPPETNNSLMQYMIKAIENLEAQARECYAEEIELDSHEFVSMMVVDGCFILELLYKFREKSKSDGKWVNYPQDEIDPAFHGDWSVAFALRRDLILLENQLPILVLNCLFELTRDPQHTCSLNELIITSLGALLPRKPVPGDYLIQSNKHILDLMRNMILGSSEERAPRGYSIWAENSVTDLQEVGIKLKAKENATSLLDITFSEAEGVLEIPVFCIGEGMGTLMPNMIALEQSDLYNTNQIMSYSFLLTVLAHSNDDVELLSRRGVINRMGWSCGEACGQIADLNYGSLCQPFHYDELCNRMDKYCRSDWMRFRRMVHKWMEMLKRDYFGSPWAVISLFGAMVLLLLTLTQTIYSIKSYSPPGG